MARVALLVGIRDYGIGLESLPAAPRDVEAISAALQQKELGYFHRVEILKDEAKAPGVPQAKFSETLERWCNDHQPDDLALLYISGHLIWDPQEGLYLGVNETRYERDKLLRSSAVPLQSIHQFLQHSAAQQQVIILDCCASRSDRRPVIKDESTLGIINTLKGDRRLVLTASDSFRYSPGQKQDRFSIYTQFLVEGIISGMADQNGDGRVSMKELDQYITDRLHIATPAIAPQMADPSQQAESISLSKAQISPLQRQYFEDYNRLIERHGGAGSTIGHATLDMLRQRMGLHESHVKVLQEIVLSPYESLRDSLIKYREIAASILHNTHLASREANYQLAEARYRLALTEEQVESTDRELSYVARLRNLEHYRDMLTKAVKLEHPLSDKTRQDLDDLRQVLCIPSSEADLIVHEVEAYYQTHQRKLEQYRAKFTEALQQGVAHNSLIREELDNFRQSLELSNSDIERLEAEVRNAMMDPSNSPTPPDNAGDRQQHLEQFRQAFTEAAKRQFPPSDEDQEILIQLQRSLQLSQDDIRAIVQDVIQDIKQQEADHLQRLSTYEDEFRQALQQQFPLPPAERERLNTLQADLNLSRQEVELIEDQAFAHWQLEQQTATDSSSPLPPTQLDSQTIPAPAVDTSVNGPIPQPSPASPPQPQQPPTNLEDVQLPHAAPAQLFVPQTHANIVPPPEPWGGEYDSLNVEGPLETEKGIDYRPLIELLNTQRWKEADDETLTIMMELAKAGRHQAEWIDQQAIATLPCTDLRTLDQLWRRYSRDHFGFSIQAHIYFNMSPGSSLSSSQATSFGNRVGWMMWDKELLGFKYYDQLVFDPTQALKGHLPAKWFWKIPWWESVRCGGLGTGRGGCGDDGGILFAFMSRLMNCGFSLNS